MALSLHFYTVIIEINLSMNISLVFTKLRMGICKKDTLISALHNNMYGSTIIIF